MSLPILLKSVRLCDPMGCSMPGLPVHHQFPEFTQAHVHWVGWWCRPSIPFSVVPFSFHLQFFPASGSFQVSQFFVSGGQNIGVSALQTVLPMNIQDWFPLGWTGWISLQSKGLSRVFSNTTTVGVHTTTQYHSTTYSYFWFDKLFTYTYEYSYCESWYKISEVSRLYVLILILPLHRMRQKRSNTLTSKKVIGF